MASEIKLQALKENVDTVEVNAVKVNPGDMVAKDQPLLEVQADKAALDVPSPVAGRVTKILVKAGDQIKIGQVYCVIEASAGADSGNGAPPAKTPETAAPRSAEAPKEPAKTERRAGERAVATAPSPAPVAPSVKAAPAAEEHEGAAAAIVAAGPATRRLARDLGIDLNLVSGTGRGGRLVEEDIKSYVRRMATAGPSVIAPSAVAPPLPDFSAFGVVERQELTRVRKLTARQMSLAWTQIPHVTQHDLADVTDLDAFRKSQEGKGPKLTITAFALKACALTLKQFPTFNASLDLANNQLVLKRYCHIGVAVDTEAGLLVPVIRDVEKKSVNQLAVELNETAEKARHGKADMTGGSFTITNLGGIGGTGFTPIVNWPEVAILGMSRGRLEPTVRGGQVVPRLMLPLSLSYDHRVIDGAAAARFTRRIAELLENPLLMLL